MMNARLFKLVAVGMLVIGEFAWGSGAAPPQCKRIKSEEILQVSAAELRARGLELVAADLKTGDAAIDVVNEYLDCLRRQAANLPEAKSRELTGPKLVHAPQLQGPVKDDCRQSAVEELLRILRDDTTAVYIEIMHPLDLLVARLDSDGVHACWQPSASVDSCGDTTTLPTASYSRCSKEETVFRSDRIVDEIRVRIKVGRGELGVLGPLSEGTWECPESGVEIVIGPLPEGEQPP